jgi:hypothetical protein
VSGSSAIELVWFEVPVDFRPAVGLSVRLGWRAGVVPMSVEPICVGLLVCVGGGVGSSWELFGDIRGYECGSGWMGTGAVSRVSALEGPRGRGMFRLGGSGAAWPRA